MIGRYDRIEQLASARKTSRYGYKAVVIYRSHINDVFFDRTKIVSRTKKTKAEAVEIAARYIALNYGNRGGTDR